MSEREHDDKTRDRATTRSSVSTGLSRHIGVVLSVVIAFAVGMCVSGGFDESHEHARSTASGGASVDEWTCPMHPQIRTDRFGACPICGMDLVEVESDADESSADGSANQTITLSERSRALARIRTMEIVPMASSMRELRLLGRISYDETRIKRVTAWTGGRIDRLLVATTGHRIRAGQSVAKLYSPEIYAAQSDLIQAAKQVLKLENGTAIARQAAQLALDAARQRLRLLGVSAKQVQLMQRADVPNRHIWIRTPFGGTVIERRVDEGDYVDTGTALYRLADLTRVWVQLDAYETDLPLVHVGDRVALSIVGIPDKLFEGRVAFIDPVVEPGTRIVKVRVEVDNPTGALRPGMFAEATLHSEQTNGAMLMLPRSAPLFTGRRSIVYVEIPTDDRLIYQAREVVLGPRAGDWYPVVSGLRAGERVVVRGAFVIDADLQIKGGNSMMSRSDDVALASRRPIYQIPELVRTSLAEVVRSYLTIGEALVHADLSRARQTSRQLSSHVTRATAQMPKTLNARWQSDAGAFAESARLLSGRNHLQRARQAYRKLGEHMIWMLQTFGNPLDVRIHLMVCEQTATTTESRWLQRVHQVMNPYREPSQSRCEQLRQYTILPRGHLSIFQDVSMADGVSTGHHH